jgi:hypothetical protein
MKTAFFNGLNAGKLDFDYNIRYRPRVNVSLIGMEKQMGYLFKHINFEHLYYVWENDEGSRHKHFHTLIKTNDNSLLEKLQKNVKSTQDVILDKRAAEYQKVLTLINPRNGEKETKRVMCTDEIKYKEIIGKHGVVHLEPILSKTGSSIYANKFTEYKQNFGYLVPALMYENPQ